MDMAATRHAAIDLHLHTNGIKDNGCSQREKPPPTPFQTAARRRAARTKTKSARASAARTERRGGGHASTPSPRLMLEFAPLPVGHRKEAPAKVFKLPAFEYCGAVAFRPTKCEGPSTSTASRSPRPSTTKSRLQPSSSTTSSCTNASSDTGVAATCLQTGWLGLCGSKCGVTARQK